MASSLVPHNRFRQIQEQATEANEHAYYDSGMTEGFQSFFVVQVHESWLCRSYDSLEKRYTLPIYHRSFVLRAACVHAGSLDFCCEALNVDWRSSESTKRPMEVMDQHV